MVYCVYPTTTAVIDDEIEFQQVLTHHLGTADCISYSSARKAIEELQNKNPMQRIQSRLSKTPHFSGDFFDPNNDQNFCSYAHYLHEEIYNKNRFSDISVLIVDYHLNETNGIEICKALSNLPAKKILLTGNIDKEKIVIEAFNEGIIHHFINKSDPDFAEKIKKINQSLKEDYFKNLTSKIFPYIHSESLLKNQHYLHHVKRFQKTFNSVEYYIIDKFGSCLFLDENGNTTWLIIRNENEIENYINIAENQEANPYIINRLKKKEMIPFFFSDNDFQHAATDWNEFLFPASPLTDLDGYFYSIINGNPREILKKELIASYSLKSS